VLSNLKQGNQMLAHIALVAGSKNSSWFKPNYLVKRLSKLPDITIRKQSSELRNYIDALIYRLQYILHY